MKSTKAIEERLDAAVAMVRRLDAAVAMVRQIEPKLSTDRAAIMAYAFYCHERDLLLWILERTAK